MKRRLTIFLFLILLAVPLALLAQGDSDFPFELNEAVLAAYETLLGFGLMMIIGFVKEGLKKFIKGWADLSSPVRHGIMYVASLVVCVIATYLVLTQVKMFNTERMILYTIYSWGFTNKWWKMLKELIQKNK